MEDRSYQGGSSGRPLIHAAIVVGFGVLATSLAQPQLLAGIPLENLLKNELHVDRVANAAFFFWASLPWYFKPLAGVITDAFPIFHSRRKSYLLIGALLAVLAWVGLYFTPHEYNKLLWLTILINIFMVVASTAVGAYMVEIAQACSGSGRLTAINNFVEQVCLIIAGPSAGYLASVAFGWTAAACGGVMFLIVPIALIFLHEPSRTIDSRGQLQTAGKQLLQIARARSMWMATGLMAVFYLAPGLQTALFYKQQNDLHMNTKIQGAFELIGGACAILATLIYVSLCKRVNLRTLLPWCLLVGASANIGYLFYSSVRRAGVIEGFNGFAYALAELAIMDLAIRATPKGSEGLGFSLMMSVRNLALFGTDWLGSKLIDGFHWSFNSVVLANATVSAITIPLVLLLPAALLIRKDAEASSDDVRLPQVLKSPLHGTS
ncbi:MAG TPA: MFS transporter [Candidatus Saccharimonadales bacterium]|nr:MFS transporter [Candidatus Saccharimonadales bacterium]